LSGSTDLAIGREAADTLYQRRGANPQAYRLYNTFTSATSFERANIQWASNVFTIGTEAGSGGGTLRDLEFYRGTTKVFSLTSTGLETQYLTLNDVTDATKKVQFSLAGITTGTTRTVTNPDRSGTMVVSDTSVATGADVINNIVSLTQAEYDAITTPEATTLYIIV
jgi:hypothetical protein